MESEISELCRLSKTQLILRLLEEKHSDASPETLKEWKTQIHKNLNTSESASPKPSKSPKSLKKTKKRKFPRHKSQYLSFDIHAYPQAIVVLRIAYFGTDFHGFVIQNQANVALNTIESELFNALRMTCLIDSSAVEFKEAIACKLDINRLQYSRCGRTDMGVHSFGNAIALRMRTSKPNKPEIDYCAVLNRVLPASIRILGAYVTTDEDNQAAVAEQAVRYPEIINMPDRQVFSTRHNCRERTYKYVFFLDDMDLSRLREAAGLFVGTHDFRNMCTMDESVAPQSITFVRTILAFTVEPLEAPYSEAYCATITAYAFLYNQIRCMMNVLFHIGKGLEEPQLISELFDTQAMPTKPVYAIAEADPLVLYECAFDERVRFTISEEAKCRAVNELTALHRQHFVRAIQYEMLRKKFESMELNKIPPDLSKVPEVFQCKLWPGGFGNSYVKGDGYTKFVDRPRLKTMEEKIEKFDKTQKRKAER